ncbi:MAG: radical SAM protein [Deltaproteobacteria bacterium]|nr:radical SAM protein [Deltaproteobacteria bacterium]
MKTVLNPQDYYRLPWTLNDNVLSWLEPTKRCNLYCEGCYSRNDKNSDKSLEQIRSDLDVFTSQRRVDSISVAGGDPLVHPDIVEIVRIIRHEYNLKPVLNTNGLALTPELLKDLKRAGVYGFTFHIDSSQSRPNWKGKNELELNDLRLHYAEMLAEVGGISANFNSTVFPHTLKYAPELLNWAREHIDIVHNMVFILFRTTIDSEFNYYAAGKKIDPGELVYYGEEKNPVRLTARDIVGTIRESDPDFEPCAYLGGTKDPQSFKWLLTGRVGDKDQIYGYVGKRFMELMQTGHHLLAGRYLAYSNTDALKHGRSLLLAMSPFDQGIRKAAKRYASTLLRSPGQLKSRLHFQSVVIIQPIDMMSDGQTNMCDGCPDITVHKGRLVWSCRLEEQLRYGCFLTAAPVRAHAEKEKQPAEKAPREIQPPITA